MRAPRLVRLALRAVPREWRPAVMHDLEQDLGSPSGTIGALRWAGHAMRAGGRLHIARTSDWLFGRCRPRKPIRSGIGDSMLNDIRYALRLLRRSPGMSGTIVLTLALGIGANTAIFSVVNTLLLQPLPYADADRLVALTFDNETPLGGQRWPYPKVTALAGEPSSVFEGVAAYGETSVTITRAGEPERVQTEVVSAAYFPLLGVQAAQGRVFHPDEDRTPGASPLVILSDALWRRVFGADANVLGQTIGIKDRQYQVIGIMPKAFRGQSGAVEMWLPGMMADHAMYRGAATAASTWWVRVVAKLRPGVSLDQAQAAMPAVTERVQQLAPAMSQAMARRDGTQLFKVLPFRALKVDPQVSRTFLLFLVAIGCVLLIACANTANLLVGRAVARRKEFAVRRAMGASRTAILRQLAVESLILAIAGGAAGLLVAEYGLQWLTMEKPWTSAGFWSDYARTFEYFSFTINGRVLFFTLAVSVSVGLLFGLAPAWHASRGDLTGSLKQGAGASDTGFGKRAGTRTRSALVVTEIALSLVLLVSAGLMVRSFTRVSQADLGFDPTGVLSMTIGAGTNRTSDYYRDVLARVSALPGVESVSLSVGRPLVDAGWRGPLELGESHELDSAFNAVTPAYFSTHRMRLLDGRLLTDDDRENAPGVVVISKALADAAWPGQRAIGRRLSTDLVARGPLEVVGVVENVVYTSLEEPPDPIVYVSAWQTAPRLLTANHLSVRTSALSDSLARSIRNAVQAVDPGVAVYSVSTVAERAARVTSRYRYSTMLVGAMAALALFLAATGIYGVMAYGMAARRKEIGIRLALGASQRDIMTMAVGGGMRMAVLGIVAGLACAYLATRALTSLLYGIDPTDPATFLVITVLMAAVSVMASYLPARRAMRVDPVQVLRRE